MTLQSGNYKDSRVTSGCPQASHLLGTLTTRFYIFVIFFHACLILKYCFLLLTHWVNNSSFSFFRFPYDYTKLSSCCSYKELLFLVLQLHSSQRLLSVSETKRSDIFLDQNNGYKRNRYKRRHSFR